MAIQKRSGLGTIFGEAKQEKKEVKITEEVRATFQVNNELLEKIRAISYWEAGVLLKDIVHSSLSQYIDKYEKKNGPIKPIPKKG